MIDTLRYEVVRILKEVPGSRSSDDLLVAELARRISGRSLVLQDFGLSMAAIKSAERCRRDVQRKNPALAASSDVREFREFNENEYRKYYGR